MNSSSDVKPRIRSLACRMHRYLESNHLIRPLPSAPMLRFGSQHRKWISVIICSFSCVLMLAIMCPIYPPPSWAVVAASWNALAECYYEFGQVTTESSIGLYVHIRMLDSFFGMSSLAIVAQSIQRDVASKSEMMNTVSKLWLPNVAVIDMPVTTKHKIVFSEDMIEVDFNDIVYQVDMAIWEEEYVVAGYAMLASDTAVALYFTLTAHAFD